DAYAVGPIDSRQRREEVARAVLEVASDLHDRYDRPPFRPRRRRRGEGVRDAPPFLDRLRAPVTRVDPIPHHRAQHSEPAHRSAQTNPYVSFLKTAAAPITPAVVGSCPDTI